MLKAALTVLLAAALPAIAEESKPVGTGIDCYCTDRAGARVDLGQVICLQVDGRMFLARCEMSLNNPMWREVQQGCANSSLSGPTEGAAERTGRS